MSKLALVLLPAMVLACGPSSAVIKTARETRYQGPAATLFTTTKAVVAENDYPIAVVDDNLFVLKSQGRWYTPEGQVDRTRGNNIARLQENSINFSVRVRVVGEGGTFTVVVEPIALRLHGLSSEPEPLTVSDPNMPGWVMSKVDALQVSIYERLKSYAVGGGAPAPAAAPPAGSAAPAAAPPVAPAAPAGSGTDAPAPTPPPPGS